MPHLHITIATGGRMSGDKIVILRVKYVYCTIHDNFRSGRNFCKARDNILAHAADQTSNLAAGATADFVQFLGPWERRLQRWPKNSTKQMFRSRVENPSHHWVQSRFNSEPPQMCHSIGRGNREAHFVRVPCIFEPPLTCHSVSPTLVEQHAGKGYPWCSDSEKKAIPLHLPLW